MKLKYLILLSCLLSLSIKAPDCYLVESDETYESREIEYWQKKLHQNPDLINTPDVLGRTPLMSAVENNYLNLAELLVMNGADLQQEGRELLTTAIRKGSQSFVEFFIRQGIDIESKDSAGRTPLIEAVMRGRTAIAEHLLLKEADINAQDNDGNTALMFVPERAPSLIYLFRAHNPDYTIVNNRGENALQIAQLAHQRAQAKVAEQPWTRYLIEEGERATVVRVLEKAGARLPEEKKQ